MQTFKWLYNPESPFNWRFIRNVLIKAAVLFVALNVVFAWLDPLGTLGRISGYNVLFAGRARLPYGETPAAYNLSLYNLEAMFASHELAGADDAENESYRVLLVGDSSVWGILLRPEETLAGQINALDAETESGAAITAYNLGYPTMSLTKDLLLLDVAMRYDPDLIVWLVTLESFDGAAQLDTALVQNNAARVRDLIARYDLDQDPDDARLVDADFWDKTIIGRRRALADLLRLQYYGVAWDVTGIDQHYREDYTPRAVDLDPDETWHGFRPGSMDRDDLAFDVLAGGMARAGDVPVLLVNEPIMISDGANSDIRYNAFYPRWAYDAYRDWLHERSAASGWTLLDLWDALPDPACYTDSAVHLTPGCSAQLAATVADAIRAQATPAAED